jgi:hypothetical protein
MSHLRLQVPSERKIVLRKCLITSAICLLLSHIPSSQAAQVFITPSLNLSENYTDNLFLDYQDKVDDFNTAAGVDLKGQILWRTAGIELNYNPTYNAYQENDDLSYWRHEAGLYTWKEFGRHTKFELRDTFLRTSDPTDQSTPTVQDGQLQAPVIATDRNRRGRNAYYTNVAQTRLDHQFGANDNIYVAYQYSILRDVDTVAGVPVDDNNISTPSMGLAYDFSQNWGMELDGSAALADYKDRDDRNEYNGSLRLLYRFDRNISGYVSYRHTTVNFDGNTEEDYNVYQPALGIRYDFQNNGRIEIGGGYYVQENETSEDQAGYQVTSSLDKRWTYRMGYFGLNGGSGYIIDDKGVQDNGLDIYYQGRLEVGYNFAETFSGSIHGGYRYDHYPDANPSRDQNLSSAGLAFNWQALRWMLIRLGYDFRNLRSDLATEQYAENRALFTIGIQPAGPFRLTD